MSADSRLDLEPYGPRPLPMPPVLERLIEPPLARHFPPLRGEEIGAAIADRLDELDRLLPQLEAERRQLRRMLDIAEEPITLEDVNGARAPAGPQATPPSGADRPGAPPSPSPEDATPPADESDRPPSDDSERDGGQDAPPPSRENPPASGSPGSAADEPERPANAPGFADSVIAELRRQRDPKTRRGLAVAMGLDPKNDVVRVGRALGQLVKDGQAEECGTFKSGPLYRAVADVDEDDASLRAQADASRLQGDDPSPSTTATPPISPRVRRELEREASASSASEPSPVDQLDAKILDALQAGPLGPRALAVGIGHAHPTERLYEALRRLIATGRVVEHRNGPTSIGGERHQFEATGR